jgi:hypothetical protein
MTYGCCGRRITLLKAEKEGRGRHEDEPQAWQVLLLRNIS